jgi:hypothetical protein
VSEVGLDDSSFGKVLAKKRYFKLQNIIIPEWIAFLTFG